MKKIATFTTITVSLLLLIIVSGGCNQNQLSPADREVLEQIQRNISPDVNGRCSRLGTTPLHAAVARDNLAVVRYLVSKGANPNADFYGSTPLDFAREKGNPAIISYLESVGARPGSGR